METKQPELFKRQEIIAEGIRKIGVNFGKDGPDRKNASYIKVRLDNLNALWNEFEMNHSVLTSAENKTYDYYTTRAYDGVKCEYLKVLHKLQTCPGYTAGDKETEATGDQGETSKNTGVFSKSDELKTQQATNFRAFSRFTRNLGSTDVTEKWDIEDKLKTLESRWKVIDETHWKLDNLLVGSDVTYELEFSKYEETYESTKRDLNRKLNMAVQQRDSAPKIEIPIFSGNYSQWPTFLDLYTAAIHNNPTFSKGQKMQHLKGKLKGEAERLVQHLPVSENNYDSCWEILNHRYNNIQLLFTKQMQTLMSQPTIQHQNSYELKRLHDTSLEIVHALRNLGVNTTTWDPILVHILGEKLDIQTYSDYMEARTSPRALPAFDEFIEFIESKFTALESVGKKRKPSNYSKQAFTPQIKESPTTTFQKDTYNKYKRNPKANHTSSDKNCPICKTNHILLKCTAFQDMAPDTKMRTIEQLDICLNCMYSHKGNKCNSHKRCRVCNNAHHTTLHDVTYNTTQVTSPSGQRTNNATDSRTLNPQRNANHVSGNFNEVLLATVQLNVKAADGTYITLRCLLDQGSQLNLITESAAQRLGLPRRNQNSTVSGIGTSASQSNGTVYLECKSLYEDYEFTTPALVMAKLLNNLPNYSFEKQDWPHIQNINLADPHYHLSRPIDILLDAGVYADIIMSSILRGNIHAPIAQQTKLGWVLVGNTKTFNCHVVVNTDDISRFWEIEEITAHDESMTVEEEYCETLYANTTKRLEDGRYEVKIPMKPNFEQNLGQSKPQAVAQFKQLEKRLARDELLASSYKAFMDEYRALQHMKPCMMATAPSCFLPHHGVIKPDSTTTKLRVVFNASAITSTGRSLNQLMDCGPNLQQDLQAMILRWRAFEYVYTADIEKFYRQIRIQETDQHLQKIVWRDTVTEPIQEYQLTTVTYGTKSAPFLAMRTIKQLVKDDGAHYPLAAAILSNQLYVDDLLGGSNNLITAQQAQDELITMLKGGGFNLRKWASNNTKLLENLPDEQISQGMFTFKNAETNKTLGISWNPHTDQFTYKQTPLSNKRDVNTKRTLLSDISKLYDPLGWLSPVTLTAKLIFQRGWTTSTSWDDPLPTNIQQDWEQFRQQMKHIHDITIPRWIGNTQQAFELHGFCDASERAYGCVVYCKSSHTEGQQLIRLVAAKTKLAPLKKPISLPRLELCGALLLARLMKKVQESVTQAATIHCWTDSMVVLGWLQGDVSRWKSFVANRVTQITQITPSKSWRHVRSEENPADCASRGLFPDDLLGHALWWKGPSWLQTNNIPEQDNFTTNEEQRRQDQICVTQTTNAPLIETLLQKYSSMSHITRVVSWILRFVNNSRDAARARRISHLTTEDIELAQNLIVKTVQKNYFGDDMYYIHKYNKVRATSKLLTLSPILDAHGVLRVGGRLERANLNNFQKHPMILPNNHKLSDLLIDQAHKNTLHGGARLTLGCLRNKYWILGGMKTVKKQLIKCVTCHRYKTQRSNQLMADLPAPRVTPSRPFTHTGVDFTGHVEIKANKGRGIKTVKAYIAIFICLCTKAVHLELVSDLSTVTFLAALKRLCARRGTPKHVYSDNGTNFVGAARILAKERQKALQLLLNDDLINSISECGIEWHFNAPSWPTAGGLWEAAVKSMKHHLKRVLGDQKLTYEEFNTLLAQIEACLNSRPLIALTNDPDDIDYLTPGHFLVGGPVLAPPMTSEGEDKTNLTMRWRLTENMYKEFWKKWSHDYLQTLQLRGKWQTPTQNIAVGDVVLIKEENVPPARWLLGRVMETHPGSDNLVRVVTLKTKSNTMKRPVTKLSQLPIETQHCAQNNLRQNSNNEQTKPTATTSQRHHESKFKRANKGAFMTCLSTLILFLVTCVTPSIQQLANVTVLDSSRLVYFDKTADLQIIQDEWKLVVYYNMSTYWKSVTAVEQYVKQIQELGQKNMAYFAISTQFEHELNELTHYNEVLQSEHGRSCRCKRGLINGIGNIANSLFGVLDDKFADKYHQDIKLIQDNEDHLLSLYKQHTSIIEGEYNLLKRNEQVMNRQFIVINKHLRDTAQQLRKDQDQATFITAAALAANMMLANLRRIQDMLMDLVTDLRNGRVDTHLLKPDAFEKQLNIISGQIPKGLSLPCTNSFKCIRQMYKLANVHGRLIEDFLIFEVKIPLVTDDQYELTEVLPIRNIKGSSMINIVPTAKYIAVNLKKDMLIPLNEQHLLSCTQIHINQLLCNFDLPIYEIKSATNICEADIINNRGASSCRTEVSSCNNEWKKLHSKDAWLFTCCEECTMRIFCPAGITSQTLRNTGTITLATGCMMRGDNHLIHSHYNLQSKMDLGNDDEIYVPETNINDFISANNKISSLANLEIETHEEQLTGLKKKIEQVKEQQDIQILKSVDVEQHHYILYGFMTVCGIIFCIWVYYQVKVRRFCLPLRSRGPTTQRKEDMEMGDADSSRDVSPKTDVHTTGDITSHQPITHRRVNKMDSGTSPISVDGEHRTF